MARTAATGPFLLRADIEVGDDSTAWAIGDFYTQGEWNEIIGLLGQGGSKISRDAVAQQVVAAIWEGVIERRGTVAGDKLSVAQASALAHAANYVIGFRATIDDRDGSFLDGPWIETEYEAASRSLQSLVAKLDRLTKAYGDRGDDHRSRLIPSRRRFFNDVARLWNEAGNRVDMGRAFKAFVTATQAPFDGATRLAPATVAKYVSEWRTMNGMPPLRGRQRRFSTHDGERRDA